jgi:uncharacterized protein YndB with AHSA1/START domain
MSSEIIITSADCEILSTRVFNFKKELLYRAWSEPDHLKNWWGPAGFTNTFLEFDFRVGGRWKFIMHGPEKGNYPNECEFIKIEPLCLIAWKRYSKPLFHVVAAFEEVSGAQTKLIFRMLFNTADECNKLKPFVIEKNEENFGRLQVELEKMTKKINSTL